MLTLPGLGEGPIPCYKCRGILDNRPRDSDKTQAGYCCQVIYICAMVKRGVGFMTLAHMDRLRQCRSRMSRILTETKFLPFLPRSEESLKTDPLLRLFQNLLAFKFCPCPHPPHSLTA